MLRFFLVFLVLQGVLFTVELLRPVQRAVIVPFTEFLALLSGWLIKLFDSQVVTYGVVIQSTANSFGVEIAAGCNGVEATIILVAAILAFPAPWKYKLIGIASGFLAIQGLNLVRIISLFYLGQWNMTAFEWAHLYVWQALIMLDALIVWLVWIRMMPERAAHAL
ncbi:exosortase H [Thioalkalivibrio thiocyanodenitrificans]|uniref:exosortase H n=1 Tax=Thioalkalivibrio thiocyanodenitrificans TaxID=243063 RepID=UPI000379BB97|nr:exosortase H [Thioalkalivibrio thiocyanodenitrificans]